MTFEPFTLERLIRIERIEVTVIDKRALAALLHTCPSRFLLSKKYFDESCTTMLEFLRWYNLLDCHLLSRAIKIFGEGFLKWQTNVHSFKSVSFLFVIKYFVITFPYKLSEFNFFIC